MLTKTESTFDIAYGTLANALRRVQFAISSEETRYYLNGVYVHCSGDREITFAATDGHRLSVVRVDMSETYSAMPSVIIPRQGAADMLKAVGKHKDRWRHASMTMSNCSSRLPKPSISDLTRPISRTLLRSLTAPSRHNSTMPARLRYSATRRTTSLC